MFGVSICVHVVPRFVERHNPETLLPVITATNTAVLAPLLNIAISTFVVVPVMPVRLLVIFVHVAPVSSLRKMPAVRTAAKKRLWFTGSAIRSLTGPALSPEVPDTSVNEAPVLVLR